MDIIGTTRRAFVGNAVGSVVLITPLAVLGGCSLDMAKALESLAPSQLGFGTSASGSTEAARWSSLIGQKFRFTSAAGQMIVRLSSATVQPAIGARPAALRQQPVSLVFDFDRRDNPADNQIFQLDHSVDAQMQLFMQRGTDASGNPQLVALLN